MYYIINLEDLPEDIVEQVNSYLHPSTRYGWYLNIKKDSLEFHRYFSIRDANYELIDLDKLKEILLIKHLRS